MNCASREEWLGALVMRDLPFDEEARAEEHLESCAECRAQRDALARFVAELPPPAPVPATRSRRGWAVVAAALLGCVVGFLAARAPAGAPPGRAAPRATATFLCPEAVGFVQRGLDGVPADRRAAIAARLR